MIFTFSILTIFITAIPECVMNPFCDVKSNVLLYVISIHQLPYNYFYTLQFICASLTVKERFELLNKYASGFINRQNSCNDHKIIFTRGRNFNLKLYSELYNDLCDSIQLVNSTFTFQLIFVILTLLSADIFAAYDTLRGIMDDDSNQKRCMMWANFVWLSIQYLIKILMAYGGSSSTDEAEKSFVIITRLIESSCDNNELKVDLNFLLNQMRGRNLKHENILFTINFKLVLAVSVCLSLLALFMDFCFSGDINNRNLSHHNNSI